MTSDVVLIIMLTALTEPVAVLMDGVDLQKLTVTVMDATVSQVRLCLFSLKATLW